MPTAATTSTQPLIAALKMQMGYSNQRQVTLSKNVANADTPGYKAMDVKPLNFDAVLHGNLSLTVTSPLHSAGRKKQEHFKTMKDPDTPDTTPTGNNVVLPDQMLKMAGNSAEFQAATALYKKIFMLIKTAAGRSS
jgi:flagellar basal-body rod protein FlgB